jgi:hypothetical protein
LFLLVLIAAVEQEWTTVGARALGVVVWNSLGSWCSRLFFFGSGEDGANGPRTQKVAPSFVRSPPTADWASLCLENVSTTSLDNTHTPSHTSDTPDSRYTDPIRLTPRENAKRRRAPNRKTTRFKRELAPLSGRPLPLLLLSQKPQHTSRRCSAPLPPSGQRKPGRGGHCPRKKRERSNSQPEKTQ